MTQQLYMNHGHPDGDLITSLLAYTWCEVTRTHFRNQHNTDWKTAWTREWQACTKVGLLHHVVNFVYESVQV